MFGQDGQTVEQPFADAVRLGQLKNHGLRVELANRDGFAADNQQVALRGMHVFIEVNAKGKQDVVGINRLAVGKFYARA